MSFKSFYKSWMRGCYEFGRRASNQITDDMPAKKANAVGTAVDAVGGFGFTAIAGSSILGSITTAGLVVAGLATAPVTAIPAAIVSVAVAAVWVGFSAFGVAMGLGFLSAGMDKMNIPKPAGAAAKVSYAADSAAQAVAKPFKWLGNQLSQAFQKAHDGAGDAPKGQLTASQPKSGGYKL